MTLSRKTSLSRLINRLLALPLGEDPVAAEGHFEILDETVDADAFALLQVSLGHGDANVIGGSHIRASADKGQLHVETPKIRELIASFPEEVPALSVEGPFADDPFLGGESARSLLLKPLTVGDMTLVTIALRRCPKKFTGSEIERFAAVAGVVNMIGPFGHLLGKLNTFRITDKLTGLGLFSEFHETMTKEVSRARRGGTTVTMGIMSVVPRESVSAEKSLLDVTRTFQKQLRDFDTLDRYSSRELVFIMPDLRSVEGVRVMDRVMGEVSSSLGGEGHAPDIYVGLSCYPEDGATVERLIEMAEAAMNQALEGSRPGVYRWTEDGDR